MLGRSRGGFSTKLHLRCDGQGRPLTFALTGGERHDQVAFPALMAWKGVRRPGPGRPRRRPASVIADRGYSGRPVRGELRRRAIRAVIPQKRNERPAHLMDWAAYRRRNEVERLVNRLKQCRRVATRYEKLAANYLAMVTLAAIRLWL